MNVGNLSEARISLQALVEGYFPNPKEVRASTEQLLRLLQSCPALVLDQESHDTISRLLGGLYARKGELTNEKQQAITQLFQKINHLQPTHIQTVPQVNEPAKRVVEQFKGHEALVVGNQQYPIDINLLEEEEMPCGTYFQSLPVELGDGSITEISLGLLAHFSDMVKAMVARDDMRAIDKLVLPQVDRQQFDTLIAFLETSQASLINNENVLGLLHAASYLQAPLLMEAGIQYLSSEPDERQVVELLNLLPGDEKDEVVFALERRAGEILESALSTNPISDEGMRTLNYFKTHLLRPIKVSLPDDIKDEALQLLVGLPVRELWVDSNSLTSNSVSIIRQMPTLKSLHFVDVNWLDDTTLANIPPQVEKLEISLCLNFTAAGLQRLQNTHIRSLNVSGCRQLSDDDLAQLPLSCETIELRKQQIGEKTMRRLGGQGALRTLILSSPSVNDALIPLLSNELTRFSLLECPVTDAALANVGKKMTKLQEFEVSSAPITNSGLGFLPRSLITLTLYACKEISDEGIVPFAKREALRQLNLYRCTGITHTAIEQFADTKIKVGWQEGGFMALLSTVNLS